MKHTTIPIRSASFILELQPAVVAQVAVESLAAVRDRGAELADPALSSAHGLP
jgi:hypothetical protein